MKLCKTKPVQIPPKPLPRLLRETESFRVVANPYLSDNVWIDQLVVEGRAFNALEEPYFSKVLVDTQPDKNKYSYSTYYVRDHWELLKQIFGIKT